MLSERFCVLIVFLESAVQEAVVEDGFLFLKCVNRCFYRAEQTVGELFEFCFRSRSLGMDFVPVGVGALVGNFVVSLQSLHKQDEFLFKFFKRVFVSLVNKRLIFVVVRNGVLVDCCQKCVQIVDCRVDFVLGVRSARDCRNFLFGNGCGKLSERFAAVLSVVGNFVNSSFVVLRHNRQNACKRVVFHGVVVVKRLRLAVQFQCLFDCQSVVVRLVGKLTEQSFGFFYRLGAIYLRDAVAFGNQRYFGVSVQSTIEQFLILLVEFVKLLQIFLKLFVGQFGQVRGLIQLADCRFSSVFAVSSLIVRAMM